MDLNNLRPSANLEDRTGDTSRDVGMRTVANLLNPLYAMRGVRGALLERGIISPSADTPLRKGLPKTWGGQ